MIGDDTGSTTIEAAVGLGVLVTVCGLGVAGFATLAAYISAVDIAGAAARAQAIGVEYQPPRGQVSIRDDGTYATAVAEVEGPLRTVQAEVVFPVEYRGGNSTP